MGELSLFRKDFSAVDISIKDIAGPVDRPPLPFPPGIEVQRLFSVPAAEQYPRISFFDHSVRYVPWQYRRFFVDFEGSFEQYVAGLSSNLRNQIRRKLRQYETAGGMRFESFASKDELLAFYPLARGVSQLSFQERLLDDGLPSSEEFKERLAHDAEQNRARGYIQWFKDRPAAYLYCPVEAGYLQYHHLGYDPEFSEWSPGIVLLYHVIRDGFEKREFRGLDFLGGESRYKESFGTRSERRADVYFFRATPPNVLAVCSDAALYSVSRLLVGMFEFARLKPTVKKLIRARAGRSALKAAAGRHQQ